MQHGLLNSSLSMAVKPFSTIEGLLRTLHAQTVEAPWDAIVQALDAWPSGNQRGEPIGGGRAAEAQKRVPTGIAL